MSESRSSAGATALTIAGHDPSSGAGITADLQVFAAHEVFGTSVITALTVQSTLGVEAIEAVRPSLLRHTLRHLYEDLPPSGIKIGMLGSKEIVSIVAGFLTQMKQGIPVVLDPILRATSGAVLLEKNALSTLHTELLPQVTWVTPNWKELAVLAQVGTVTSLAAAEEAMQILGEQHPHLAIVATGGDQEQPIDLLRLPSGEVHRFEGNHVTSTATHGTGCAFSSALLARLLEGKPAVEAVSMAKDYVTEAIRRAQKMGHGKGPMNLLWPMRD
jgi:hydroxymethylpyrimidine/phosphomethylpyrimidine kinase